MTHPFFSIIARIASCSPAILPFSKASVYSELSALAVFCAAGCSAVGFVSFAGQEAGSIVFVLSAACICASFFSVSFASLFHFKNPYNGVEQVIQDNFLLLINPNFKVCCVVTAYYVLWELGSRYSC